MQCKQPGSAPSLAQANSGDVTHVALHALGFAAAEHAGSPRCLAAGGGPADLSPSLAIASLSPAWAGLQHGLLAGGLGAVNATPSSPLYGPPPPFVPGEGGMRGSSSITESRLVIGPTVWEWALSAQACDAGSDC